MKHFFYNILVVLISILLSVLTLVLISLQRGMDITFGDFMYGLLIGGGQAFIPFLIFFSTVNFIIVKVFKKNYSYKSIFFQLLIWAICMSLVILIMTMFDLFYDTIYKVDMDYLSEYNLFIVFVPFVILINYLGQWQCIKRGQCTKRVGRIK